MVGAGNAEGRAEERKIDEGDVAHGDSAETRRAKRQVDYRDTADGPGGRRPDDQGNWRLSCIKHLLTAVSKQCHVRDGILGAVRVQALLRGKHYQLTLFSS